MPKSCPNCGSDRTQKCSAIYSSGTFSFTSTASGRSYAPDGSVRSENATVTTEGKSDLAARCTPPHEPISVAAYTLIAILFGVIMIPIVYVGFIFLVGMFGVDRDDLPHVMETVDSITSLGGIISPLFRLVLFVVLWTALMVALNGRRLQRYSLQYPMLRRNWETRWYCHTCDSFFHNASHYAANASKDERQTQETADGKRKIICVFCGQNLRVPSLSKDLLVTCASCGRKFRCVRLKM